MPVLRRYLIVEILKGSTIAMVMLVTLFNIFTLTDELHKLGEGTYTLAKIFEYVALTTPRVFYELMPSSALLGSLFIVGAMANNREIVAIRAIGLSTGWIIRTIMLSGLVMVVVAILVGELIAPDAEHAAQILRSTSLKNEISLRSQYGMWMREGKQFINVKKILNNESLSDIWIYEVDDSRELSSILHADNAKSLGDSKWQLDNLTITKFEPNHIATTQETNQIWNTDIDSDLLQVTVVDTDNLSIGDLFSYINFLKDNNQKSQKYELALWGRLINPFIVFVMLMVSSPFVIGIGRMTSTGARIMVGIVIGSIFNIFDKIFSHIGLIYELNPFLVAVTPSLIVFLIALHFLRRDL